MTDIDQPSVALPASCTLSFEDRPGYLYAKVSGPSDSFAISMAYWTAVSRECALRHSKRLLMVEDLRERANLLDVHEVAGALAELGFRDIRIAFVDLLTEELPMMQYAEIVAQAHGIRGRVFSSEETAQAWLISEPDDAD